MKGVPGTGLSHACLRCDCRRLVDRQSHSEDSSAAGAILGLDPASLGFDEALDDSQPPASATCGGSGGPVEFIEDSQKLVEIKPEKWLEDDVVICKLDAGELKAHEMGITFEVWTEMHLFGHVYNQKNMRSFITKIRNGEHLREARRLYCWNQSPNLRK